jgi:predicted enzyme related to lactoylglutathione lyase
MDGQPPGKVAWIQVDCSDPERLARFWAELLDVGVQERTGKSPVGPRFVVLQPQAGTGIAISFQWVPEPKRSKNRLHLDLVATQGLERVSRLVEQLGGSRSQRGDFDEHGWKWRQMADPEGNEFCLVPADDDPRV